MSIEIIGIAGSLRRESLNRRLLEVAARALPPDVRLEIWDGLERVPPFSEDHEAGPAPRGVEELRRVLARADGVLIATPEYNGSIPGQLKNALDWASRPRGSAVLEGKPVATLSASPTPYGAAWAQADLRRVLKVIGADLCGDELALPHAFRQFDADGGLADADLADRLAASIAALAARWRAGLAIVESA
ncbi:MAG TPA: NAD(P)H-dependent oxidoreductase [Candidatus Dormibacteraeota bacterium]|jgi:chromate reductase